MPLFRDLVFDGAADPSLVWNGPEMAWYVFYAQRHANQELPGISWAFGTQKIDAILKPNIVFIRV